MPGPSLKKKESEVLWAQAIREAFCITEIKNICNQDDKHRAIFNTLVGLTVKRWRHIIRVKAGHASWDKIFAEIVCSWMGIMVQVHKAVKRVGFFFCIYWHLPDTFQVGVKISQVVKVVLFSHLCWVLCINSVSTLLGAVYQPMLKQKITRKTLRIDVLEELEVQWKLFFLI